MNELQRVRRVDVVVGGAGIEQQPPPQVLHARHRAAGVVTVLVLDEWARILESQLSAVIKSVEGVSAEVVAQLRDASCAEDKLPYEFGPPSIDKLSDELLGETLLAQSRPADARTAFEKALARAPEPTSLRGLMTAAVKSGDTPTAAELRARLRAIWHRADQMPPEIR